MTALVAHIAPRRPKIAAGATLRHVVHGLVTVVSVRKRDGAVVVRTPDGIEGTVAPEMLVAP